MEELDNKIEQEPVGSLLSDAPEETSEEVKEETSSETKAGDWREMFEDKDLKTHKQLLSIDSIDELAASYIALQTKLDAKTGATVKPVSTDTPFEEQAKVSETMFNISKEAYDDNSFTEVEKEIAFKHKVPPVLLKAFISDTKKEMEEATKRKTEETLSKYREEINKVIPSEAFETRFNSGLKALGITLDQYKKILPEVYRNEPTLVKAISSLGQKQYSKKEQDVLEGKAPDLSTNIDVITAQIKDLAQKKMSAKLQNQPTYELEKDLKLLKLRHAKLSGEGSRTSII